MNKKINLRACYNRIWSWSPMPCEKHGPRASITTKTSAFGLGPCFSYGTGDHDQILQPIGLSGPHICCPMLLNTGSGGIDIFWIKLTFEMLTVRGQQHSFLTQERGFLGKCQSFWERKCLDLRGTQTPNLRINAECSNLLSYQGHTFAVPSCWIQALAVQISLK